MKLTSRFALLDVEDGRKQLAKRMPPDFKPLPKRERIPVVIHGWISCRHGVDNGTSIEFGVDVDRVEVLDK